MKLTQTETKMRKTIACFNSANYDCNMKCEITNDGYYLVRVTYSGTNHPTIHCEYCSTEAEAYGYIHEIAQEYRGERAWKFKTGWRWA